MKRTILGQELVEADVTINGVKLDYAQSSTLRVGLWNFMMELQDAEKEFGPIGPHYVARASEVMRIMLLNEPAIPGPAR